MRPTPGRRTVAAGLWLSAGTVYLLAEGLSAAAFTPAYSYAENYISDLGVPDCGGSFGGRAICSPLHNLMNAGFILQGLLFVAAAMVAARTLRSRARYALVGLATINCVGISIVGVSHEAAAAPGDATLKVHVLGAFLAIVAGNATALVSSIVSRELRLPAVHRVASVVLPIAGIAALIMLILAQARGPILVPDGIWERGSVYTITAWEILTGLCLLRAR